MEEKKSKTEKSTKNQKTEIVASVNIKLRKKLIQKIRGKNYQAKYGSLHNEPAKAINRGRANSGIYNILH